MLPPLPQQGPVFFLASGPNLFPRAPRSAAHDARREPPHGARHAAATPHVGLDPRRGLALPGPRRRPRRLEARTARHGGDGHPAVPALDARAALRRRVAALPRRGHPAPARFLARLLAGAVALAVPASRRPNPFLAAAGSEIGRASCR